MRKTIASWVVPIIVGVGIAMSPVPEGLSNQAWYLLAVFLGTIIGFILQPLPIGAIAFISITITQLANILKPSQALAGFGNSSIWLIVAAFLFAKSFIKTGLGRRIAFWLIKKMGTSTLKLAYTIILSDLIISPATPSNAARAGGILFPIVRGLASAFDSEPNKNPRRVGAFLMQAEYQGNTITSAMFMTSMAGNPLAILLASQALGINMSWGTWALAAIVPGLIALAVVPYYLYKVYPPELKKTPEAQALAHRELADMGPMSHSEKMVAIIFIGALLLWSTSNITGIHATVVALLGVSSMLVSRILEWQDVLDEKGAWDTLIWMGTLVGLAGQLAKTGIIDWMSVHISSALVGVSWLATLTILLLIYFYIHYGFASLTAHITALYSAFVTIAVAAGAPVYLAVLVFAFASNLCMSLTHYAAAPAPIYFGAGYVSQQTWWKLGFQVSVINIIIWFGIGSTWWYILGLW
ncbi:anion permease [Veillonella sp. R32]|nr:anion permease [Veillonella sp. R32]